MEDDVEERRRHPRFKASLLLFYSGAEQSGCCYIRDISESGAFVEMDEEVAIGTRWDVEIFLDLGDKVHTLQAGAEVARTRAPDGPENPGGVGLHFVDLGEEARSELMTALARLSELQGR